MNETSNGGALAAGAAGNMIMSENPLDIYLIIERTKHLDPQAFMMKVDAEGMPAGFVDPDNSRRTAAYLRACAELHTHPLSPVPIQSKARP